MDIFSISLLKAVVVVPFTLLPIINPLSGAPVFISTAGYNDNVVRKLARQVAINSWIVIVASMLVGIYVLDLFGISLAVVRIGGGLLVAASGWRLLNNRNPDDMHAAVAKQSEDMSRTEVMQRSFFPITFPLTVGPGSIAACITLGSNLPSTPAQYLVGVVVAVLGATVTVGVVYLCYRNAGRLLYRLGDVGTLVMVRIMAFILLCIGIEIMWTGWAELNNIPRLR